MNQLDNDLQKAIDDITNSTNADPVFSDTVAAPTIPPAVNIAPEPVAMEMPSAPAPSAYAPISAMPFQPAVTPGTTMRDVSPATSHSAPIAEPAPRPTYEPVAEEVSTFAEAIEDPTLNNDFTATEEVVTEPAPIDEPEPVEPAPSSEISDIKAAALRDLAPLLGTMDIDTDKKIGLYEKMIHDLHDTSVVPNLYDAIKELPSDRQGDALLNLLDTIDNI